MIEAKLETLKISSSLKPTGFDIYLKKVFQKVVEEINKIALAFYNVSPEKEEIVFADKIFSSIERTWVGIFNNALIKADESVSTLQEFAVWSYKGHEGRCDLLFEWNKNHFLVEAKNREFNHNWQILAHESTFSFVLDQAQGYYRAEESYYPPDTFAMALIFEWVRNWDLDLINKKVASYLKELTERTDNSASDFAVHISGKKRGVLIYGKIKKASDVSSKL